MGGLKLLEEARSAGLKLEVAGDRLVIRGPKSAAPLAQALLDHKADVLPLLLGHPPATVTPTPAPFYVDAREWFPGWQLEKLAHTMHRVSQQAGLPGVTFHTLRHTFASHAVMNGVDLFTVGKLLGHKTIQQTARYAHLAPDHMRTAVEQTARALFAPDVPRQVPRETPSAA